ncbi:hypothetical protein ACW9YQ_33465 (plasmid) [Paraburkholderia strydomiana]
MLTFPHAAHGGKLIGFQRLADDIHKLGPEIASRKSGEKALSKHFHELRS